MLIYRKYLKSKENYRLPYGVSVGYRKDIDRDIPVRVFSPKGWWLMHKVSDHAAGDWATIFELKSAIDNEYRDFYLTKAT